jgi:hypothetical protein
LAYTPVGRLFVKPMCDFLPHAYVRAQAQGQSCAAGGV